MTLRVLLIPYALYVALFGVFSAIDFYHMKRFGTYRIANLLALLLFFAGTAGILFVTADLLIDVDWDFPLEFSAILPWSRAVDSV